MARIDKLEMQGFKSFSKKTTVLLPSNFSVICGPNGSGKCLKGSAKITVASGKQMPIGAVVDRALSRTKKIETLDDGVMTTDNSENIKILTLDLKTMKIGSAKVSAFIRRKSPKHLLTVTTRSGKQLTVTPTHPFFTIDNSLVTSVQAEQLSKRQRIATPRILPISTCENESVALSNIATSHNVYIPYSDELSSEIRSFIRQTGKTQEQICNEAGIPYLALKGLLDRQAINAANLIKLLRTYGLAEKDIKGWLHTIKGKRSGKIVKLPAYLEEQLARFLGYLISEGSSSVSSDQLRFVSGDNAMLEDFGLLSRTLFGTDVARKHYKPGSDDSIIYSAPLQKYLEVVFDFKIGGNATNKVIPPQIFSAPCGVVANLLAGMFDGDGYLQPDGNYFEYSTASRELANGIVALLLRFGIPSMLKKKRKTDQNGRCGTYWSVYVYGHTNLSHLVSIVPFRNMRKVRAVELIKTQNVRGNPNVDTIPNITNFVRVLVKLTGTQVKKLRKICPKLAAYYEGRCECSREGLIEVLDLIGKTGRMSTDAKQIAKYLRALADSDIFWDEIVKIEKTNGEDYVYDLCIEGTHNFVADNFIVHNSNVLDGICFVLGRTSAKSLRADRMHEMIFNGGAGKTAAETAKVAMFFDNADKTFPVEEGTVVVSRTVNRRGVSIYKLNGRTVTREKVLEVLRAAHITPDGYNIILQGDITEVIEMSPLDRREIIDEVAGIAEFDDKRDKAQRELATVEERLKESAIILNERAASLEKLEREAGAADSYNTFTAELDKLRASLAKTRLADAEAAMGQLNSGIHEREKSLDGFDRKIVEIDKELAASETALTALGDALLDRSGDIAIAKEVERLRAEIARRRDMMANSQAGIRQLENVIAQLEAMQARSLESSPAVREILKLGRTGVYGTVASLSKVPAQYQTAIEVCAGPHLWDIVVADENIAVDCVNHLKRSRIGRATFLPLDKIREREGGHLKKYLKQPGVVGLAIDLIQFDKKYWHAFSFLFGDTLIVDKIETARRIGIGNGRMVTLDGDLVERSGAIIGGFYRPDSKAFAGTDQIAGYSKQKEQLTAGLAKLEEEIAELETRLTKLVEQETKGSAKLKADLTERTALEQAIANLRLQRKEFAEGRLTAEAEVQNLRIKRARLDAALENVKAEFANYAAVKDTYTDMRPRQLEDKINETITAINGLGAINQRAPDELAQLKPAYTELKGRVDTLTTERDRVIGIMAEIEGRRKSTFTTTMNAVAEQFKIVYKDLTGGEGSLKLEEPENIESGLLIEACPPGRKVLNIDAMSGGEKTLTALAFLFAIQRFRPAPFYILDEIDAALDKPNTKKTVDLIKKYSDRAQFIVISHNDSTVAAADCVYGVSMEEGESKLVGIRMPA